MKKSILTLVCLVPFWAHGAMTSTEESNSKAYRFEGDVQYASFCKAVLDDDVELLQQSIRGKVGKVASSSGGVLRLLLSEAGVTCDGANLVEFSQQRKSEQVNAFFASVR